MTVLVGVHCKDGVVVGSDSAATFAAGQVRTIEQLTKKIDVIGDHVIVAGTGAVGLGQRFTAIVQDAWDKKIFTHSAIEIGKYLSAAAIQDFASTHAGLGQFGALVAFPCHDGPQLIEFGVADFQPELKEPDRLWYVSMGSGQAIADPFLALMREVFWDDGTPSHTDGTFAVTWTLTHAIKVNPGGVNGPPQIAVLSRENGKYRARLLDDGDLAEHQQNVQGAIEHLRLYPLILKGEAAPCTPEPPTSAGGGIPVPPPQEAQKK